MPSIDELRARYAGYSIDELQELRSDETGLTDDARLVLEEEWRRRGLPSPAPSPGFEATKEEWDVAANVRPTWRDWLKFYAAAVAVALLLAFVRMLWESVREGGGLTISPALIVGLALAATLIGLWVWQERASRQLSRLLSIPRGERDAEWNARFLRLVQKVRFGRGEPETITGRDGFRYSALLFPVTRAMASTTTIQHLRDRAIEEGRGIVINPRSQDADWVFAHGALLQLRVFGDFYSPAGLPEARHERTLTEPETIQLAAPSEEWLPLSTRVYLRRILQSAGVRSPRVLLAYNPKDQPPYTTVFHFGPEDGLSEEAILDTLRRLAWYLPSLYPPGNLRLGRDEAWVQL